METVAVLLNFHDLQALQFAGLQVPQPATIQVLQAAVPIAGDFLTFPTLTYPSGEQATFRVVSRVHEVGGHSVHRVQLDLELVVLHQP